MKHEGTHPILFETASVPVQSRIHTVYIARPDLAGAFPTVMLVGGAKGLTSPLRDLCRRLARHGYAALAPDLYAGARVPEDDGEASWAFRSLGDAATGRILNDVGRYISEGRGPWDTADAGFGIIVTQAGALAGLRTAIEFGSPIVMVAPDLTEPSQHLAESSGLDAESQIEPAPPGVLDELGNLVTPVLGLIGREDEVTSMSDVAKARNAAPQSQWVVYEGVGHDFMDDNAAGFDGAAFGDGLDRIMDFMAKNL